MKKTKITFKVIYEYFSAANQKKSKISFKAAYRYLATVLSWSFFIILLFIAGFLLLYFLSNNIFARRVNTYRPPLSIYTIVSPSMVPTIDVYDVIINKRVNSPADIKKGDIITFSSTSTITYDMTITHRVKEVQVVNGKYEYTTQGDNNLVPDLAPAKYEKVIGVAKYRLPQLGRIQMFVSTWYGYLTVIVIPAFYIIMKDLIKLLRMKGIMKVADNVNSKIINTPPPIQQQVQNSNTPSLPTNSDGSINFM